MVCSAAIWHYYVVLLCYARLYQLIHFVSSCMVLDAVMLRHAAYIFLFILLLVHNMLFKCTPYQPTLTYFGSFWLFKARCQAPAILVSSYDLNWQRARLSKHGSIACVCATRRRFVVSFVKGQKGDMGKARLQQAAGYTNCLWSRSSALHSADSRFICLRMS